MSESASGEADSGSDGGGKDSSVCPTCGQVCKSAKGKRQHHKRSHGESIAKVTLECEGCGTDIKRWKSQLDKAEKKYCSNECYHSNYEQPSGPESSRYNRVEVECGYCGEAHLRRPSRIERVETLYCSRECADKDHSKRMQGAGNPKWDGGDYDDYYGPNWKEQRQKAIERDNSECQYCGHDGTEIKLSVHHIQKVRSFKAEYDAPEWWKRANELNNLITLCRSCHGLWEGIPLKPQRR